MIKTGQFWTNKQLFDHDSITFINPQGVQKSMSGDLKGSQTEKDVREAYDFYCKLVPFLGNILVKKE